MFNLKCWLHLTRDYCYSHCSYYHYCLCKFILYSGMKSIKKTWISNICLCLTQVSVIMPFLCAVQCYLNSNKSVVNKCICQIQFPLKFHFRSNCMSLWTFFQILTKITICIQCWRMWWNCFSSASSLLFWKWHYQIEIFSDTTIQRFNVTMILRNETVGHSFKYVLQQFWAYFSNSTWITIFIWFYCFVNLLTIQYTLHFSNMTQV